MPGYSTERGTVIDMRTVSIMMLVTNLLSTVLLIALWVQARSRFKGLEFWAMDFALQAMGMFLIILRDQIPDYLSVVIANILIAGGGLIGLLGYGRFLGKKIHLASNLVLLALFSAIHFWFGLVDPAIGPRNLNIGIYLLVLDLQVLWLILVRTEKPLRKIIRAPLVIHALFALMGSFRTIEFFLGPGYAREESFFSPRAISTFGLFFYQVLLLALTYGFVIAVSRRLVAEISGEHQKFSRVFHGSPYAMVLVDMPKGTIAEVNAGFEALSGYPAIGLAGRNILELELWERPEERREVLAEMEANGRTRERELLVRRRDSSLATVLFSSESLMIGNRSMILAAFSDISDRKRMEERIRDLSRRDPLTGIFNRRHAFELLERLVGLAAETPETGRFSLALLDMDLFKAINDDFGHLAGDNALTSFTGILLSHLARGAPEAVAARYGGEEFIVLFPGFGLAEAAVLMGKVLEEFRSTELVWEGKTFSCSFSCGVADSMEWKPEELSVESMIALADGRMYDAKHAGRGRICAEAAAPIL